MSGYIKFSDTEDIYLSFSESTIGNFDSGDSFSICFWLRTSSSVSKNITLIDNADSSSGWKIYLEGANLRFWMKQNGQSDPSGTWGFINDVPWKLNEWQFFVITVENGYYANIYIDAVSNPDAYEKYTVLSGGGAVGQTGLFYIGKNRTDVSGYGDNIDFACLGIFEKVLSQSEIEELYNKGYGKKLDSSMDDIVFGLNFDDESGENITDVKNSYESDNIISLESGGAVDTLDESNLKLYLTSSEYNLAQTNYSQSIGGYSSTSLLYLETELSDHVGLYDTEISLETPDSGDWNDWSSVEFLSIGPEIIKVSAITSGTVSVVTRNLGGSLWCHRKGDVVRGITTKNIFNSSFDVDYKQYRCFALKNISDNQKAYNFRVYFEELKKNSDIEMKMAIEIPSAQKITSSSTSWSSSMLIDSSLVDVYDDDAFEDCYITFNSGPNQGLSAKVNSYDGDTGTFVFVDSLSVDFDDGSYSSAVSYTVDVAPAQRVKSGMISPSGLTFTAADEDSMISVSIDNRNYLSFEEVIYIWVERTVKKAKDYFENDDFVICCKYTGNNE